MGSDAARRLARLAGAATLFVASAPRAADPPPLRFQDLSAVSGGPYDFGAPTSTLEKSACAFVDVDGDGWDDAISLAGRGEPHRYLLNRADETGARVFVPAPAGNGLDDGACLERDGGAIAAGDVDGDGDEDLFVGSTWNASRMNPGEGRNVLLLNDGTGRFTDVAEAAGLHAGDVDNTTCAAVFLDFDLDGDLDLFTCNTDFAETAKEGDGVAHLWRNEIAETGTLSFVEETAARGVVETGLAVWAASGVDYDQDGDFDLLVPHDIQGLTQLFRNDGTGHFADVTDEVGAGVGDDAVPSTFGDDSGTAMGVTWGDYDNDGDLDLYVTNIGRNPLYRNNGDGTFTEVSLRANARAGTVTWGCNFADFDLDGFVDLYVAGGDLWEMARTIIRSSLYRNLRDGTFAQVWSTSNLLRDVPELGREHGTAVADFDGDGRVDLFVARAEREGASPYLYRNETDVEGRRWLTVRLRGNGRTSNTSAIGARIRVVPRGADGAPVAGLAQLREVQSGDSRASESSRAQTFGLGAVADRADVVVTWPRAGTLAARTETYRDVAAGQRVVVTEDPRAATWRLEPAAEAVVPDATRAEIPCFASGDVDPLTRVTIESGPAWASVRPDARGPVVVLDVPRSPKAAEHRVVLLATAQGATDPESRQTLTVRTFPQLRLAGARRRGAGFVEVVGDHLGLAGLRFRLDGVEVRRGRTRVVRRAGTVEVRTLIAVPKSLRRALRTGAHVVEVTDPVRSLTASVGF